MRIREKTVAEVVTEASTKMSDPNYSSVMVGGFVQSQSAACQFITAHADDLGGTEKVVTTIFYAALIALCFQRANNRTVREMQYDDLNHVSDGDPIEALKKKQPVVHEYIELNGENPEMKKVLSLLAMAMDWVS